MGPHPNPLPQGEGVGRLTRGRLRQLQRLRTARERREQGRFLIDGEKLVREAIAAEAPIAELLSTSPEQWVNARAPLTKISQADAERLSDTRTPQGHFALVRDELNDASAPTGERWQVAVLDAIQDTGNVGGIIRSAGSVRASIHVLVGAGSSRSDPSARVTRAATGAWFRVRIERDRPTWQRIVDDAAPSRARPCWPPISSGRPAGFRTVAAGPESRGCSATRDPANPRLSLNR